MKIQNMPRVAVGVLLCVSAVAWGSPMPMSQRSEIINGSEVEGSEARIKHSVMIHRRVSERESYLCTGVLVGEGLVLTAAHCVLSKPEEVHPESRSIYIVFTVDPTQEAQIKSVYRATDYRVHPRWAGTNSKGVFVQPDDLSDLALISFRGKLPPGYGPIPIIKRNQILSLEQPAFLEGFGKDRFENENFKPKLRSARLNLDRIRYDEIGVANRMGVGACQGDSGGGLFVEVDGMTRLAGILSYVYKGCSIASFYINLQSQMDFIESAVQELR